MSAKARKQGLRRGLLAGVLVVLLLLLAFTAWQAFQVRSALRVVASELTVMVDAVSSGDTAQGRAALDEAAEAADTADTHSRGPVWWTASKVPFIGDDVTAVRTISDVAHDLTGETLPGLLEVGDAIGPDALTPRNGRFALEPVAEAAPVVEASAADIATAARRVRGIDTAEVLQPLRAPLADLRDKLDRAERVSAHAAIATRLVPDMLGGEGPRTYLVMVQNNAEIRALGGMPGALALLTAEDGAVRLAQQGRPATIGTFPDPFIELTPEERALFTPRVAVYPQDTVFIPDFPRAAGLLKQMWEARQPQQLDGVISLDPVGLSYLLRGTGPITLDSGATLTADNAADVLMNQVYLEVETNEAQNELFDEAARKIFGALVAGGGDPVALLDGLAAAAGERRLMLWSAEESEQAEIASTAIAGELPVEASARPEVGVYLNDSAADKLSYYLDHTVDVIPQACFGEDEQVLDVRVTMRSTVPEGTSLSPSVVGPGIPGRPLGVMRHSVYVYAPVEGRVDEAALDGEETAVARYEYRGREVAALTVELKPGEERVIEYELFTGPEQPGEARLLTTPAALGTGVGEVADSDC